MVLGLVEGGINSVVDGGRDEDRDEREEGVEEEEDDDDSDPRAVWLVESLVGVIEDGVVAFVVGS